MLQGQVALGGRPWRTPPPTPPGARAQARARVGTLPTRLPRLLTSRACARRLFLLRAETVPPELCPSWRGRVAAKGHLAVLGLSVSQDGKSQSGP